MSSSKLRFTSDMDFLNWKGSDESDKWFPARIWLCPPPSLMLGPDWYVAKLPPDFTPTAAKGRKLKETIHNLPK